MTATAAELSAALERGPVYVERLREVPETCPVCGVRDHYVPEVYGMRDGIVALCRHCGEGWLDLTTNVVYGKSVGYQGGSRRPPRPHRPRRSRGQGRQIG